MSIMSPQIESLLKQNGFDGNPRITLLKQHNHVYQIEFPNKCYYLKTYTKDWYGSDIAGTGYCVDHEIAAWRILSEHNLNTPQVALADTTLHNSLGRPFLLTAALQGESFTQLAKEQSLPELLFAVGRYMAVMHGISFDFPGYITSAGLNAPPAEGTWQHPIWTFEQFRKEAFQIWQHDRQQMSIDAIEDFYQQYAPGLEQAYSKPHFVHGDCHASQFYLYQDGGQWTVSGVVDMEVASAGDSGADFVKFGIEMAALFPASTGWWKALFEGYGSEPSFDLIKLRMLAAHPASYDWIWSGSREQILRHIIESHNWHELFDLSRIGAG